MANRAKVIEALTKCEIPSHRLERFIHCGGNCTVEVASDGSRHRLRADYCGDRFCDPCQRSRSMKIQESILRAAAGRDLRFVTLTLEPMHAALSDQIDHLLKSFVRLRETRVWSDNVDAAAYFIEFTRGKSGLQWHVHAHALVSGSYIPQPALKSAWERASLGSYIVDVRQVSSAKRGAAYVAKYAGKGFSQDVLDDPDALQEAILALRGRRMLSMLGDWRSIDPENPKEEQVKWTSVGSLDQVVNAAQRGKEWAIGVMKSLKRDVRWDSEKSRDVDRPPDPWTAAEAS